MVEAHAIRRIGRPVRPSLRVVLLCGAALSAACASAPPAPAPRTLPSVPAPRAAASEAVRAALAVVGTPYRLGGDSPTRGFDCSGLVTWSYENAGVRGLPHSAALLERRARPISWDALQPGDLLFFRLSGTKTSHVGLYVGNHRFVHAPSGGKTVEVVSFDHVYWSRHLGRAGRLVY